jgi:hypothetical protein
VTTVQYRLVVKGELGPRYRNAFEGMELEAGHGETAIVGPVKDQAQLQGLIARIASLGLALVSVVPADAR